MVLLLKALVVGAAVGCIFGSFRLPIPAPPTLAGIVGVLGIYLGFMLARHLR